MSFDSFDVKVLLLLVSFQCDSGGAQSGLRSSSQSSNDLVNDGFGQTPTTHAPVSEFVGIFIFPARKDISNADEGQLQRFIY